MHAWSLPAAKETISLGIWNDEFAGECSIKLSPILQKFSVGLMDLGHTNFEAHVPRLLRCSAQRT